MSSIVEGLIMGLYKFTKYITEPQKDNELNSITFILTESHDKEEHSKGLDYGKIVGNNNKYKQKIYVMSRQTI